MTLKFTKILSVLAIILAYIFFWPGMTLAMPVKLNTNHPVIIAQFTASSSEINFTPQVRQQLQAVRQRRNREISKVLDSSQIAQFNQSLHSGDNFFQALAKLELQREQKEMVDAIAKISELKIKAILSRHSLQSEQK